MLTRFTRLSRSLIKWRAHLPQRHQLTHCSTGSYLLVHTACRNILYQIPSRRHFHLPRCHSKLAQEKQLFHHSTFWVGWDDTNYHTRTHETCQCYYMGCLHSMHFLAPLLYLPGMLGNKRCPKEPGCSLHSNSYTQGAVYGMYFRSIHLMGRSYEDNLYRSRFLMDRVDEERHRNTSGEDKTRYVNKTSVILVSTHIFDRNKGTFA